MEKQPGKLLLRARGSGENGAMSPPVAPTTTPLPLLLPPAPPVLCRNELVGEKLPPAPLPLLPPLP
jgi:hypothetical protein